MSRKASGIFMTCSLFLRLRKHEGLGLVLESDLVMGPVAERLVLRVPAPAEGDQFAAPDVVGRAFGVLDHDRVSGALDPKRAVLRDDDLHRALLSMLSENGSIMESSTRAQREPEASREARAAGVGPAALRSLQPERSASRRRVAKREPRGWGPAALRKTLQPERSASRRRVATRLRKASAGPP